MGRLGLGLGSGPRVVEQLGSRVDWRIVVVEGGCPTPCKNGGEGNCPGGGNGRRGICPRRECPGGKCPTLGLLC